MVLESQAVVVAPTVVAVGITAGKEWIRLPRSRGAVPVKLVVPS